MIEKKTQTKLVSFLNKSKMKRIETENSTKIHSRCLSLHSVISLSYLGWLHDQIPDDDHFPCSDHYHGDWMLRLPSSRCCWVCYVDACECVRKRHRRRLTAMRREQRRRVEQRALGRPSRCLHRIQRIQRRATENNVYLLMLNNVDA